MQVCKKCNSELEENSRSCINCGEEYNKEEKTNELVGIKGWLILVGFGVLLSPLKLFYELSEAYLPLLQEDTWQQLVFPSSEGYNIDLSLVLLGETIFNLLMIMASIYLIYLFFTKKTSFPKLYILILVVSILFIPIDALLVSFIFPEIEAFDSDTVRELIRSVVAGTIWIHYMLISERVKATFVN